MAKIEKEYAVLQQWPYDTYEDEIIPMPSKKEAKRYAKANSEYFVRYSVVSRPIPQDWEVIEPSPYRE